MPDRHTCRLCLRSFSNGRALGGHMRSHVISAAAAAAASPQLHDFSPSPSSTSHGEPDAAEQVGEVEEEGEAEGDDAKQLGYYGLRENPRKSFRLVDPEFSSTFAAVDYVVVAAAAADGGSSIVLQDRESETESSKPPSLRRRSKRRRRASPLPPPKPDPPSFEPEPVSSVSDTTPEEDVARCLMMLSRDIWTPTTLAKKKKKSNPREEEAAAEEDDNEGHHRSDDSEEEERIAATRSLRRGGRSKYQCSTCRKVFRSYQALGGHRASHKKVRNCAAAAPPPPAVVIKEEHDQDQRIQDADSEVNADRRIHECPVCFRVFVSGQALGGHKRSHLAYCAATNAIPPSSPLPEASAAAAAMATTTTATGDTITSTTGSPAATFASASKKFCESFIDLNLPAPMEDEVELSAVYDAE